MVREFNVVIEKDEDGFFVASVPALRGCHTQAKSLDTLIKRIREAIELCLEVEEPVSKAAIIFFNTPMAGVRLFLFIGARILGEDFLLKSYEIAK